jgi:hypothetical protein
MAAVTEKDHDEMLSLLMAVDEIVEAAGVDVVFIIAHTGRMQHEEGKERARGATVIDDWPDARWIMTKLSEGDSRFLAVEGRGVAMATTSLVFDEVTKRSVLGYGGKAEVYNNGAVQAVLEIVTDKPGILREDLVERLKAKLDSKNGKLMRSYIAEAVEEAEMVFIKQVPTGRGGMPRKEHYPVVVPEGGATPRLVNMRAAFRPRGAG